MEATLAIISHLSTVPHSSRRIWHLPSSYTNRLHRLSKKMGLPGFIGPVPPPIAMSSRYPLSRAIIA